MKFSQISKLLSRLRMINIRYGTIFGTFLDQMGKAFDGEKKENTLEQNLALYRRKVNLIRTFSNGNKGKFDIYAQKIFLFGTMRENYDL